MSDQNNKQDKEINEVARDQNTSNDAANNGEAQPSSIDNAQNEKKSQFSKKNEEGIESLKEKETKVEKETLKNTRDVNKVKDELKKERQFNSYNSWLSVINFALLILLIMGIYIYESSYNAKNKTRMYDLKTRILRVEDRIQSLSEANKVSDISIQNLATQTQDQDAKLAVLDKQIVRIQSKFDATVAHIQNASPSVKAEPEIKVTHPTELLLNEANYLIKLSYRKMYLEHDVATSISLLRDADVVLNQVDDPQIIPVRRGIATDIAKLSNLEPVDSETLVIRLSALEENLKNLPVLGYKVNFNASENNSSNIPDGNVSEDISDWKDNLANSMGKFFGSLMVIKKNTSKNHQFLSADEVAILQDKISLTLMQAQLAVYAQQQTSYEQNLSKVASLIEEYYDLEDSSTEQMLNEINSLQSQNVIFIGVQQFDSLNLLREFFKKNGK